VSARQSRSASLPSRDPVECRCLCGSLIARRVEGGVELKCRRCKRQIVLPLEPESPAAVVESRP
jgi:hypothetical protein